LKSISVQYVQLQNFLNATRKYKKLTWQQIHLTISQNFQHKQTTLCLLCMWAKVAACNTQNIWEKLQI